MGDRSELLSQLTVTAAAVSTAGGLPSRLCEAARILADADGASLALVAGEDRLSRVVLWATDPVSERLDQIHDALGYGPAFDAVQTGATVAADVSAPQTPWPVFAELVVRDTDVRSVAAVPMHAGEVLLGVLVLYRSRPGGLSRSAEDLAFVADAIGVAVVQDTPSGSVPEGTSWDERSRIHQAVGMVMAQLAMPASDSLALLRAHAFARDLTLEQVARQVLERHLAFDRGDGP